jgi:hypothetical protein
MTSTLPIGDFSRATHLSVKMLRHYHELGLSEPVDVDLVADQGIVALVEPAGACLVAGPGVPMDDVRWWHGPGGERGCDAPDLRDGERDHAGFRRRCLPG